MPPKDFTTHNNYIRLLNQVCRGISISHNIAFTDKLFRTKAFDKKLHLAKLSFENIRGEYKIIEQSEDYAELCVSWLPVKSYYLIYNLFCLTKYLISGDVADLTCSHNKAQSFFKNALSNGSLSTSSTVVNRSFTCQEILSYKVKAGANLVLRNPNSTDRFYQLLKKLLTYKLDEFKRNKGIKDFRGNRNRYYQKFISENTVNAVEFFYLYRIKSNYRDLEFISGDLTTEDYKDFYTSFFETTMSFYDAFRNLINGLARSRFS